MLTATRNITLFNSVLDTETRREILIPTNIAGVAFYEVDSSSFSGGIRAEAVTCKIRIPIDADIQSGRAYLPELKYAQLDADDRAGYWALKKGDYVLLAVDVLDDWTGDDYGLTDSLTRDALTELTKDALYTGPLITVLEYADNTLRGSQTVKHWRIGGQ